MHTRTFPIHNAEGEKIRIAGITEDITERKRAADQLRYSEKQLRQLTENINAVFWLTTTDRKVLYLSPAYEKIWGASIADAYADPLVFTDPIYPDDRERVLAAFFQSWGKREQTV